MERLAEQVEARVRQATHGRIRHLRVEADRDRVVIRGLAPTYHAMQQALHGALQLLPGDRLRLRLEVART